MKMRPIVVAGPFGVGKDYAADMIAQAFKRAGARHEVFALGDHYYEELARRERCSVESIRANKARYRSALQEIGAEPEQQAAAVRRALARIQELEARGIVSIVTARKPCEITPLREAGARAIGLSAPLDVRAQRVAYRDRAQLTADQQTHRVEVSAEDLPVDVVIPNGADAGALFAALAGNKLFLRNDRFGAGLDLRRPQIAPPSALRLA